MKQVGYSIIEFSNNAIPVIPTVKPCIVHSDELVVVVTISIFLILSVGLIESFFEIKNGFKTFNEVQTSEE